MKGVVIIFVKAPVAGRVKTRLARDLGPARAAALFRCLTRQTIAEAAKSARRTILAIDPPTAMRGFSTVWPPRLKRRPQARGDLGARMAAAFASAPKGPIVIIGADAPGLRVRHLRRAFRALAANDAVFGPTDDGGYWLVGLSGRRAATDILRDVRWSTRHALNDSAASLPKSFRTALVDRLRDIDDLADLKALGPRAMRRSAARL
jgi:hypothetical protein